MDRPWFSSYEEGVPRNLNIPDLLLPEILEETAASFPETPAVIFHDRPISYREIHRNQVAHKMRSRKP